MPNYSKLTGQESETSLEMFCTAASSSQCELQSAKNEWFVAMKLCQDFLQGHHHVQHRKGMTEILLETCFQVFEILLEGGPHCSRDFHEFCPDPSFLIETDVKKRWVSCSNWCFYVCFLI